MEITFAKPALPQEGAVVVGVLEGRVLTPAASAIETRTSGSMTRAMAASHFEGRKEQALMLLAPSGLSLTRIVLVGLGKAAALDALALETFGGVAVQQVFATPDTTATVMIGEIPDSPLLPAEMAAHIACGARLRAYRFDKYRTREEPGDKPALRALQVMTTDVAAAYRAFDPLDKVVDAVCLARTLASEPANVLYPESFAAEARKLENLGLSVEILGEGQIRKLGMNALLAVGQGSVRESQLVVLRWFGAADPEAQPLALVGKGVTFDSGGLSIKPSTGMGDMKWDMAGAGVVFGVMQALAACNTRVNVVGVVGMVENMPSGTAQRPGDVITSASGQTIEVLNTDAEGRLVLADALWYVQEYCRPTLVVDLATLTGAIVIALGTHHAGLFANDDTLADRLLSAGESVGERLWRMPLGEYYDRQIKSDTADMKNTGDREAGAITAAQFLQRFAGSVPWAHLDIAGVTWSKQDSATVPKGATAFGVRLLERFITEYYTEHYDEREERGIG
ncbi:Cytosol aminopeptidase PepA [invertebrate metagenome]|uniref:leucyl aminopeptidase n=1 Tax=invertebrate metagenome TaxID=1711999 RepID=A0A484H5R0_9ZZZZ